MYLFVWVIAALFALSNVAWADVSISTKMEKALEALFVNGVLVIGGATILPAGESCPDEQPQAVFGNWCTVPIAEISGSINLFLCASPNAGGTAGACDHADDWALIGSGSEAVFNAGEYDKGGRAFTNLSLLSLKLAATDSSGARIEFDASGGDMSTLCKNADDTNCNTVRLVWEDRSHCFSARLDSTPVPVLCLENTSGSSWKWSVKETAVTSLAAGVTVTVEQADGDDIQKTTESTGEVDFPLTSRTMCAIVTDAAAAYDNMLLAMWAKPVIVTGVGCKYQGSAPSTAATFTLEDDDGNAMTITGTNPTCAAPGTEATFAAVTAANTLLAGEGLRFDITNTPDPATDEYLLCVRYRDNP